MRLLLIALYTLTYLLTYLKATSQLTVTDTNEEAHDASEFLGGAIP